MANNDFLVYHEQFGHAPTFFVGIVIRSIPCINALLVRPALSAVTSVSVAYMPIGNQDIGADVFLSYPPGTNVLCCRYFDNNEALVYVIASLNFGVDQREDYNERRTASWLNGMSTAALRQAKASWVDLPRILTNNNTEWLKDRSHGAPTDTFTGDVDIRDRGTFAGLRIGRGLVALQASPAAYVEVNTYTHAITAFAKQISCQGLTHEYTATLDYITDNVAVSINEALGTCVNPSMIMSAVNGTNTIEPAVQTNIPLYRMQAITGAAIVGRESLIIDVPRDAKGVAINNHTADTEPAILSRSRQALDGELSQMSARGSISVKTPFVPGIHQLGYGATPKTYTMLPTQQGIDVCTGFDDLRTPYEPQETASEIKHVDIPDLDTAEGAELEDAVTNAAVYRLIDGLLSEGYKKPMLAALAKHGLFAATANGSLKHYMPKDSTTGGPTDATQYPLPASVQLTDPATGETRRYFDSTSFISQEPDGSICICDGYGSEIRMSRGNIYISPALDLQLRPGRDLSAMAGRHQSYNSLDTCTINSHASVHVKAEGDMELLGANSGRGRMSLSCMNTLLDEGCGLVINSASTAVIKADSDLYMGATNGMMLDAASGYIYTKSSEMTIDSAYAIISAMPENLENGSAIVLQAQQCDILTSTVSMPCALDMTPYSEPAQIQLRRNNKHVTATCTQATSRVIYGATGAMFTNGVQIKGGLVVDGTILANAMYAFSQPAKMKRSEANKAAVHVDGISEDDYYDPIKTYTNVMRRFYGLNYSIDTDSYVASCRFMYPDYNVNVSIVPAMAWQYVTGNTGGHWHEQPVNGSWVYPGAAWQLPVWRLPGQEAGTLTDGYIINVRK